MHASLSNTMAYWPNSCLEAELSHGPLLAVLTHHFMGDCLESTCFENTGNLKY